MDTPKDMVMLILDFFDTFFAFFFDERFELQIWVW